MSAKAQWLRLSVNWSESEWLDALEWPVRAVWPEFLARVKSMGRAGTMAKIPVHRFAGLTSIPVEYLEAFITAAITSGALIDDGDTWTVAKWKDYQLDDATGAERQRAFRESQKLAKVTESNGVTPGQSNESGESNDHNAVMPVTGNAIPLHNAVTPSCATTRPPDHLTKNNYKQEESTSLLPNGNEKPEKAPDLALAVVAPPPWWESHDVPQVIRDAVLALCEVPRFRKRFENPEFAVIERETMFRCLEKSRQKKFSDQEFVALALACMNYFASKKSNVSGSLSLENWIRNQREVQKPKSAPGDWMGKTFGRGDERKSDSQIIEGDVIHAKFG